MFNSGEGGPNNGENAEFSKKNKVVGISEYKEGKKIVEAPESQKLNDLESEPGIANPELSEYRVELSESATFNDLLGLVEFEHGRDVADKVKDEIEYQIQNLQPEVGVFSLDSRILDFYEEAGEAEYWLPVILG